MYFVNLNGATEVVIPNGVTSIEEMAFSGCEGLLNVLIPSSVMNIYATNAFVDCHWIESITVSEDNSYYRSIDGFLLTKDGKTLLQGVNGDVIVPPCVTSIGFGAFQACSNLTSVTIPASVTNIEDYAFSDCHFLTNITFIGDAPTVAPNAFYNVSPECQGKIMWNSTGWNVAIPGLWNWIEIDYLRYVVDFDANGGVGGFVTNQAYASPIVAPVVSREGYTFVCWSPEIDAAVPASNVIYTAQWRINQYEVAFDANGGFGGVTNEQDYASGIVVPEVTREGYTLVGWLPEIDATVPASNVTYTAQWQINQYAVAFDANGGIGGVTNEQDYASGIVAPEVTREGYTFVEWTPEVDAAVPASNVTYTAQWTANQYKVAFDANGGDGEISDQPFTYDVADSLAPNAFSRVSYRFVGWSTNDAGEVVYEDGAIVSNLTAVADGHVLLYAQWAHWDTSFVESATVAEEGNDVVIRVIGGSADTASSVKVYLTYNTAKAADVDLAKGTVAYPSGFAAISPASADEFVVRSTNLKFPLTLSWAKGKIGEKVITIPIKTDKVVEDDEFFTLQLAEPQGMELGEERVCTVTVHDPNYDILAAKVDAGTATKAEQSAWDKMEKAKAPYVRGVADSAERGKVTGSGLCAAGKKVTLKAAANKGWVFVGWTSDQVPLDGDRLAVGAQEYVATTPSLVIDRTAKPAKDTATSTTLTDIDSDTTFYACFIAIDDDRDSIALFMNGEEMAAAVSSNPPYQTNVWAGVYLEWPIAVEALSQPTVKVAGLPAGLKFTAKDIVDSKTKQVTVPANTIYGAPTAASKVDAKKGVVPFSVKVTATTAGKSSQTFPIDLYVDPLPAWAVGSFDGSVAGTRDAFPYQGLVTMTIAANGKISCKVLEGGKTWALSAASFDVAEGSAFLASVIGKAGKEIVTNEVTVGASYPSGLAATSTAPGEEPVAVGVASSDDWIAYQNLWKRMDTKAAMPLFKKSFDRVLELSEPGDENSTVKLTFKKDGVVSFTGKVDGTSVSGSSQLVWGGGSVGTALPGWQVTLYAPPKATAKPPFAGWCETFAVTLTTDDQGVVTDVGL